MPCWPKVLSWAQNRFTNVHQNCVTMQQQGHDGSFDPKALNPESLFRFLFIWAFYSSIPCSMHKCVTMQRPACNYLKLQSELQPRIRINLYIQILIHETIWGFFAPSKLCDSTATSLQKSRFYDQSYNWPLELYSTKLSPSWPDKNLMSLYICTFKKMFTEGVLLIMLGFYLSPSLCCSRNAAKSCRQDETSPPNFV